MIAEADCALRVRPDGTRLIAGRQLLPGWAVRPISVQPELYQQLLSSPLSRALDAVAGPEPEPWI